MNSSYGKYFTKMALAWGCCFVAFFFAYMLLLAPQKSKRVQLENQLKEKKKMHDLALNAAKKETKAKLYEQLESLQNELHDFVIDFEDSTNLTLDISRIANEKKVSSFSVVETKSKSGNRRHTKSSSKNISECHIGVSFHAATFNQFANLLNALERHKPPIFINDFTINRAEKDNSEHRVKMSLAVFIRNKQSASFASLVGGK